MKITTKEYKYILIILKVHKESCIDFMKGFKSEETEEEIFINNLIKKLEEYGKNTK